MLIPDQSDWPSITTASMYCSAPLTGPAGRWGFHAALGEGEMNDISETRDAIALTVLRCASAGARDVQALKVSALRCLFGKATLPPASQPK